MIMDFYAGTEGGCMKFQPERFDQSRMYRLLSVISAVVVNVLFAFVINKLGLPFYLDSAGTIFVAALCGTFPGVITAVVTNTLCSLFNPYAIYYTLISVLIAICTAYFVRREQYKKVRNILIYIPALTLISGVLGTVFQWMLLGAPQFDDVAETASIIAGKNSILFFLASLLLNLALNLFDKGISAAAALISVHFIPAEVKEIIRHGAWRQKPLTNVELREIRGHSRSGRRSISLRMTMMLSIASLALTLVMGVISVNRHYEDTRDQYSQNALNAARFAASVVDADRVDIYLRDGEDAPGYKETRGVLYRIRESAPGVKFLYVVKITEDGCYYVFDCDSPDEPANPPGFRVDFEEAFLPYVPDMLAGKQIPPIESNDVSGWVLTTYYPVINDMGRTVCYAGVDVSMSYLSDYTRDFALKTILVFSGFFVLILGYGLWVSGLYLIYPIGSIAAMIDGFDPETEDLDELDDNVRRLRSLDIRTGDEVETLYNAVCKMSSGTAEQLRSIRYLADSTAKMQNGLIITMADLVENRDSDTGAHIQKTAAYVKIIAEGLKRKGYYAEKLTPKFISDIVTSAPLHDIGKIHISDTILNKPGKLTPEEYEIMKTHTTAGREIMEKAISTVNGENYLKEAKNMAAYHHERWDGKGYPEGLHGQVIPLSARIMAVADVFDALASPRIYKPAYPFEKALEIIEEGAGAQFDPKCVEVFLESLTEVRLVLEKYQES